MVAQIVGKILRCQTAPLAVVWSGPADDLSAQLIGATTGCRLEPCEPGRPRSQADAESKDRSLYQRVGCELVSACM